MSRAGSTAKFKHTNKTMRYPFVIHANFEANLKNIATVSPNPHKSYTGLYQQHVPYRFCYCIKSSAGDQCTKFELDSR